MFRYTRSVTVKLAVNMPAALQFAGEVTAHLNKTYGMKMRAGAELFGETRVHWFFDIETLDEATQLNGKLMQDRTYWEMLEKAKHLWVDGGMNDRIVQLLG